VPTSQLLPLDAATDHVRRVTGPKCRCGCASSEEERSSRGRPTRPSHRNGISPRRCSKTHPVDLPRVARIPDRRESR